LYILLFFAWLAGVVGIVGVTLGGDLSDVLRSLGMNGTVTESAGDALGLGKGFFERVGRVVGEDETSVSREFARLENGGAKGDGDGQGRPRDQAPAKAGKTKDAAPAKAGEPKEQVWAEEDSTTGAAQDRSKASAAEASGPGRLTDVAFESRPEAFTARLTLSRPVSRYTYFWMPDPRRLVVDVRGKWEAKVGLVHRFDAGLMKKAVLGEHADRLRLVLYYRDPQGGRGPSPSFEIAPPGLVFTARAKAQ
jgi:hypothetical protein